ncbi:hypothetical protein DFH09DRAFT_1474570 [Mycena vulgaris]|nr:hypothetical protein DFH09DRAFT_1474570 [Mycena vulgaris]
MRIRMEVPRMIRGACPALITLHQKEEKKATPDSVGPIGHDALRDVVVMRDTLFSFINMTLSKPYGPVIQVVRSVNTSCVCDTFHAVTRSASCAPRPLLPRRRITPPMGSRRQAPAGVPLSYPFMLDLARPMPVGIPEPHAVLELALYLLIACAGSAPEPTPDAEPLRMRMLRDCAYLPPRSRLDDLSPSLFPLLLSLFWLPPLSPSPALTHPRTLPGAPRTLP